MLRILFIVALIVTIISGGKALESQTHVPQADTLFAGYDNIMPESLLEKVAEECRKAGSWHGTTNENFMHGKKATFWLQTDPLPKPRSHIEEAVLIMAKYALRDMYAHRDHEKILGAEWWVQVRSGSETIGFHYDKDEAMASLKQTMKHPLISTVTYLTDIGAPTLIFNQTTDGNNETPEIPNLGWISYPRKNRHITFSGDLQHGVLGSASKSGRVAEGRVTLLINWWEVMPMEPNTMVLSDDDLRSMGIYHDSGPNEVEVCLNDFDNEVHQSTIATRIEVPVSPTPSGDEGMRHEFTLPPGDLYYVHLPKDMSEGAHELRWSWDEIYGSIGNLDLDNRNIVGRLFRLPEPKLIFIYDKKGKKGKKLHEKMIDALWPIAKTYVGHLKIYFAPTSTAKGVLSAFGLSESDLPKLVIDETAKGDSFKHIQPDFKVDADHIKDWIMSTLPDLKGHENEYH